MIQCTGPASATGQTTRQRELFHVSERLAEGGASRFPLPSPTKRRDNFIFHIYNRSFGECFGAF